MEYASFSLILVFLFVKTTDMHIFLFFVVVFAFSEFLCPFFVVSDYFIHV